MNKILFPTDGSDIAECALEVAVDLAKAKNCEVVVLHVIDDKERLGPSAHETLKKIAEGFVENAKKKIAESGVKTTTKIVEGKPHEEILKVANEGDVELIVMGTHGATGLPRALLGSVADRVVRTSTRPVVLVPKVE